MMSHVKVIFVSAESCTDINTKLYEQRLRSLGLDRLDKKDKKDKKETEGRPQQSTALS